MGFPPHLLYQPSLELSEQLASVSLLGPWPWLQHQQHGRPSGINPPLLLQPLDPATPPKRTASHTEPLQSRPPTRNTGVSLHTGLTPLSRASLTSQRVGFQCSPTPYEHEGYQGQMSFTLSVMRLPHGQRATAPGGRHAYTCVLTAPREAPHGAGLRGSKGSAAVLGILERSDPLSGHGALTLHLLVRNTTYT